MIFTPLSRNGKRRLRLDVLPFEFPRGKLGAKFAVTLTNGKTKRVKVVACDLGSHCACDARII